MKPPSEAPTPSRAPALADRPEPRALLDATAAGALLGVPATWMLAEARADRIPYVRLGHYVRFDPEELDLWWRARARGPWRRDWGSAARAAQTVRAGSEPGDNRQGGT